LPLGKGKKEAPRQRAEKGFQTRRNGPCSKKDGVFKDLVGKRHVLQFGERIERGKSEERKKAWDQDKRIRRRNRNPSREEAKKKNAGRQKKERKFEGKPGRRKRT